MASNSKNKFTSFLLAFLLSVAGIICFYLIGVVVMFLLALIIDLLPSIIAEKLFFVEYTICIVPATILCIICELFKNGYIKKYSYIIFGTLLLSLNVIFLIINIFSTEGSLAPNIIQIILGAVSLYKGVNYSVYD